MVIITSKTGSAVALCLGSTKHFTAVWGSYYLSPNTEKLMTRKVIPVSHLAFIKRSEFQCNKTVASGVLCIWFPMLTIKFLGIIARFFNCKIISFFLRFLKEPEIFFCESKHKNKDIIYLFFHVFFVCLLFADLWSVLALASHLISAKFFGK